MIQLESVLLSARPESERQPAPSAQRAPSFSGPLNLPNRASANSFSAPIKSSGGEEVHFQHAAYYVCSGELKSGCPSWIGFRDSMDDKSKPNVVQIKGRFQVTSENLDLARVGIWPFPALGWFFLPEKLILFNLQASPLRKSASVGNWILESKMVSLLQQDLSWSAECLFPNNNILVFPSNSQRVSPSRS